MLSVLPNLVHKSRGKDAYCHATVPRTGGSPFVLNMPSKTGFGSPKEKDYTQPILRTTSGNTNPANMAISLRPINEFHYSAPPINSMNALQVVQGFARDQPRGMAYSPRRPLNNPILYERSNFFTNRSNPLTDPSSQYRRQFG